MTKAQSKHKLSSQTMRVKIYPVLQQAIQEGVAYGWSRAHKHVDKPTKESIQEHIEEAVLNAICEWFEFDNE